MFISEKLRQLQGEAVFEKVFYHVKWQEVKEAATPPSHSAQQVIIHGI